MSPPDEPPISARPEEIESLLERVRRHQLGEQDLRLLERLLRLLLSVVRFLEQKNTSLARLKRLLFGPPPDPPSSPPPASPVCVARPRSGSGAQTQTARPRSAAWFGLHRGHTSKLPSSPTASRRVLSGFFVWRPTLRHHGAGYFYSPDRSTAGRSDPLRAAGLALLRLSAALHGSATRRRAGREVRCHRRCGHRDGEVCGGSAVSSAGTEATVLGRSAPRIGAVGAMRNG